MNFEIGKLAISKSGHDKGKLYVIISVDDEYVYLVDGKIRTLDRPKKKNKKHVQLVNHVAKDILKCINNETLIDENVKRFLKLYESKCVIA